MNPEIRERAAFQVMGIQVRVNPMTANYQEIWGSQYAPREAEVAPFSPDKAHCAVYFCAGQGDGLVDLVAGMRVEGVSAAPEGLVLRQVPAAREAVFTATLDTIGPTWGRIYGDWLPNSGFERDDASADYEVYPPEFGPQGGTLTIHVPIRKKA